MLKAANASVTQQAAWIAAKRTHITDSLARLDSDFDKLAASAK